MHNTINSGTKHSQSDHYAGQCRVADAPDLHDPLVARLLPLLNDEQLTAYPLHDVLKTLFHAYIRQSKRMKRIVRISDGYQSQLQELQARIKGVVEMEERSRLYRDLHDGAGQSLHAVRLHLQMLADGKGGCDDPQQLAAQLAQEVADVAAELHDIAHQLRPSYLLETSLDAAIARRCEIFRRRGVPVEFNCEGDFRPLFHEISDNFYRIAQEALANAARHSDAGLITITLTRQDNEMRLVISDDGCGMETSTVEGSGMGLRIMQERAELINASLNIASSSSGTTITVSLETV